MGRQSGFISFVVGALSKLVFLAAILGAGGLVWGVMHEPAQLRYTPVRAKMMQWPQHWDPVKFAVMTDLHVGSPHIDLEKLEQLVSWVNGIEPDIVLLLGEFTPKDYFSRPVAPASYAPVLGKLRANYGVFALPAGRDLWRRGGGVADALKRSGIEVLQDSAAPVRLSKNKRIWIAGLGDDPASYDNLIARLPKGEPVFAMVHNPTRLAEIPFKVGVVFAGSTYGGIADIPSYGPLLMPTGIPRRYAYGLVEEQQRLMYVSGGIGTGEYPIRLNMLPEIAVITVAPAG